MVTSQSKSGKILIWGAAFRNKGSEAMMRTVQRELARRLGAVSFHALLPLGQSSLAYSSGIIPVGVASRRAQRLFGSGVATRLALGEDLLRRRDWRGCVKCLWDYSAVSNHTQPFLVDRAVGGFDAVVDAHGFAFGDDWGTSAVQLAREWCHYCVKAGKPFFFMPQSWGSFQKTGFAEPLREMLTDASLFYARDRISQRHLAEVLGRRTADVPLAPDIALRFEGAPLPVGASLLELAGVKLRAGIPVIGITPNLRVYERTEGAGGENAYLRSLVRLCDNLVSRLSAQVVIFSTDLSPYPEDRLDDRYLCGMIRASVKDARTCISLQGYHSAEEIKSVVGNCDILIGSRFHALVFALSQSVPCLALGWSHKYRELLAQFGMEEYVCEHDQLDESVLLGLAERLWRERETCRSRMHDSMEPLVNQVDALFDKIAVNIQAAMS